MSFNNRDLARYCVNELSNLGLIIDESTKALNSHSAPKFLIDSAIELFSDCIACYSYFTYDKVFLMGDIYERSLVLARRMLNLDLLRKEDFNDLINYQDNVIKILINQCDNLVGLIKKVKI